MDLFDYIEAKEDEKAVEPQKVVQKPQVKACLLYTSPSPRDPT